MKRTEIQCRNPITQDNIDTKITENNEILKTSHTYLFVNIHSYIFYHVQEPSVFCPFSFPDQKTTCWKGTTRKTRTDVVAYHYRSLASVNAPFNSSIPLDILIRSCYGEKSGTCTFNYRKYGFLYISMIQLRK